MRILRVLFFLIMVPFVATAQTPPARCGYFTVLPQSEALIFDRSGRIKRKLGPGLQICMPFLETYLVEDTLLERQEDVESAFRGGKCKITVSVIWNISDLEKYYSLGRDATAASGIHKLVQEALAEISGSAMPEISQHLHVSLRAKSPAFEAFGVHFLRAPSTLENCTTE